MAQPNIAPAKKQDQSTSNSSKNAWFAPAVIVGAFVLAELVFHFILGAASNFEGNDPLKGHPIGGNMSGTVYKGGFIVPLLMTMFICVVVFSIERYLTLNAANGKGALTDFLKRIKVALEGNNVDSAISECDKQKGSVANIVRSGLMKYKEMSSNTELERDQKVAAIQQEVEEATALEMPMLHQNMPIISTIASVGTLVALLGTVIGMIKAFSALATSGAPDPVALECHAVAGADGMGVAGRNEVHRVTLRPVRLEWRAGQHGADVGGEHRPGAHGIDA